MFKYSYCNVYVHFHLPTTCLPTFCVSYRYLQAWACFIVFFMKVLQGLEDHMKFFPPPLLETVLNNYCVYKIIDIITLLHFLSHSSFNKINAVTLLVINVIDK